MGQARVRVSLSLCVCLYSFDIHFIFGCYSSFCSTFHRIDTYFLCIFFGVTLHALQPAHYLFV